MNRPRIIGHRKNGAPIYEIKGASPDDPSNNEGQGDDDDQDGADDGDGQGEGDDDKDGDDKPLGEKGERALRAEKQRRKEAQRELRRFKELGLTPEEVADLARKRGKDSDDGDDKLDADELRRQAREEARREANAEALRDRVADKIEAKARAFADAEDAVAILLRSNDIDDFIDDGKIDVDAITEALDDLGKNKPHLLAQGKRFQGSGDGGARSSKPTRPGSLGEAVKLKMTPR